MTTPICDFIRSYGEENPMRLHMPGHKGKNFSGMESADITEVTGADSLYEAAGIIRESENNAGLLFGAPTFYSTEGCSQCIRAMLYLTLLYAKKTGKSPLIAAGRNAHKSFLSAAALLDLDILWLYGEKDESYLSCKPTPEKLDAVLGASEEKPVAVYLTSPDYLGHIPALQEISQVCHRHGCLLLVDNAHGAYLRFLTPSRHPIDLGADLCCDSAHKTLPVLTGGAYLHIAPGAPRLFAQQAKDALMLFGSTSPSYLILQSLDQANAYISQGYPQRLQDFCCQVDALKDTLKAKGYTLQGDEPLKLTLYTKPYGYTGTELSQLLLNKGIVCEFSDPDFVVMMLTPEISKEELSRLQKVLCTIPQKAAVFPPPPVFYPCKKIMSPRKAALSPSVCVPISQSVGRVLSSPSVGCPPAVPIVVCGEEISREAVECFGYYGIESCRVIE